MIHAPCLPTSNSARRGLGGLPEYFGGLHGSDPTSLADSAIFCGDSAGGTQPWVKRGETFMAEFNKIGLVLYPGLTKNVVF